MEMGRSGFWIRLAAAAIDAVVLIVLYAIVRIVEMSLEERDAITEEKQRALYAMLCAVWLVYTSMEALVGATIGKLLMGVVITLPDGAPAPPWSRVLRWTTKRSPWILTFAFFVSGQVLFNYLANLLGFVLLLGVLRMLDEEKRAWHDYWTHTAVVSRKRAAAMQAVHEEAVGAPPPT